MHSEYYALKKHCADTLNKFVSAYVLCMKERDLSSELYCNYVYGEINVSNNIAVEICVDSLVKDLDELKYLRLRCH